MAIAFARLHYISRAKGHSAVAAIAYRSGQKLLDERTGKVEDYHNRSEHVAYSEILLPDGADARFNDREFLWNAVEAAEDKYNTRRNQAQVARDCILALPRDETMTHADHVELARRFAHEHFVQHGLVADINIHYDDIDEQADTATANEAGQDKKMGRNPHAHILVTTRRLIGDTFDRHKARDLNPKVANGKVVDADNVWHDDWRTLQNNYFAEKGLSLEVDPNGLISQVHLGKEVFHHPEREKLNHWQENERRKAEGMSISLADPNAILNQITLKRTVFTETDLAKLVNAILTQQGVTDPAVFQKTLLKVQACDALIALGPGSDGKSYFTTRAVFDVENDIQLFADHLKKRHAHGVSVRKMARALAAISLTQEQRNAVSYLLDSQGIAALVAPTSVAKHQVLAVARDAWIAQGYRVQGVTLSDNRARRLRTKTNIDSRTVESLRYRLHHGKSPLTRHDVLVIDSAEMLTSHAYRDVLSAAAHAGAKVVYTGDPHKGGEAMCALLERTGHFDLRASVRQRVGWQQTASADFAVGKSDKALRQYAKHDQLHFGEQAKATMVKLIQDWQQTVQAHGLSAALITAVNSNDVAVLNKAARASRIAEGDLRQGTAVATPHGTLSIAIGERLQLLKNDKALGVSNGDIVTVVKMARDKHKNVIGLEVAVDGKKDGTIMIDLREYAAIDYGYAARINQVRMRDALTDYAFTYVSGWGWNRQSAYVANSHHRLDNTLYVDADYYRDEAAVAKAFGRLPQKDSVYDWPWHFRQRRGLGENATVTERFKHHLQTRLKQATTQLRDNFDEKFRPTVYWSRKQANAKRAEAVAATKAQYVDATRVYDYTEAAKKSGQLWHQLLSDKQKIEGRFDEAYDLTNHTLYQEALAALAARDALAAELHADIPRYQEALTHYQIAPLQLEKQAASYTGRAIVAQYVNECALGRELHRNKLAYTIMQDSSRFEAGMTAHGVDWKTLREHGRSYERKLLLKALDEDGKQAFAVVEAYHTAALSCGKQWKAYLKRKNSGVAEDELADAFTAAKAAVVTRNALAGKIIQDKARYQTGLQFYHIEKAEQVTDVYAPYTATTGQTSTAETVFAKRAVKLERYGQHYLAEERFKQYQASTSEREKSELADIILRYPRFHNRHIAEAANGDKHLRNDLYHALRNDAVVVRRERLMTRLSTDEKNALPLVEHFVQTRHALRQRWKDYFDNDKPASLLPTLHDLVAERDRAALKITQSPSLYQKGLALYAIKAEHLAQSIDSNACRERVAAFMSPFTSFDEKVKLADFMITERAAHRLAGQQAGLDWFTVYPYADIKRHRALRDTLDLTEKGDFEFVGRYRRLSRRLASLMRMKSQQNKRWDPKQQAHFDRLAALRNQMASQLLDDVNRYITYLDAHRLTPEKLRQHASRHTVIATQLYVYHDKRVQLINAFNALVKAHGSVEALGASDDPNYLTWRKQWAQLSPLAKQWLNQLPRLTVALNTVGLTEKQLQQDADFLATLDRLVEVATGKAVTHGTTPGDDNFVLPQPVQLEKGRKHFDSAMIKERLNECAEAVAMAAVSGDEILNTKMSNGKKLIWGKKGGSLQVTISGPNTGYWNDFSQTGRGGRDLLSFISVQQGLSFKEAIDWAARFLGLSEGDMTMTNSPKQLDVNAQKAISSATFSPEEWKRIASARRYWDESLPLEKSLAEMYLIKHRAYNGQPPDFYRYHPAVWNSKTEKKYPALIVGAKNTQGEIQAIQAIYLSPDANKISAEESPLRKWSRGVFKGAGVWLNGFDATKPTAIVEGPETAASILEANGHQWNVVCACGSKNFKHIGLPHEASAVVLILDHDVDNAQTEQNAVDTLHCYADRGIDAWFVKPKTAGYDFNDVHQHDGITAVKEQLAQPTLFRKGLDAKAELDSLTEIMDSEATMRPLSIEGWQREIRRLASIDQTTMALDLLQQQSLLTEAETHTESLKDIVMAWGGSYQHDYSSFMVCENEKDRQHINNGAHHYLALSKQFESIHTVMTTQGKKDIGVGGTIRFINDFPKKSIKANTLAKVQSIEKDKLCVRCDNGKKVTFSLSEYRAIENGYALSPKDALDKKCDKTFMFASKGITQSGLKSAVMAGDAISLYYNKEQFKDYNGLKAAIEPNAQAADNKPKPGPKKAKTRYNGPSFDM